MFRQRSDGITHTVNVESREEGFRAGSAAQAAKRSRQDGDVDLLGVILNTENCNYKFFVEYASNAYVIRGQIPLSKRRWSTLSYEKLTNIVGKYKLPDSKVVILDETIKCLRKSDVLTKSLLSEVNN